MTNAIRSLIFLALMVGVAACSDSSKEDLEYVGGDSDSATAVDGTGGNGLCAEVTCEALDACHGVGVCDATTGECSNPVLDDGTGCDDGNACTYDDVCVEGVCEGGGDVVCSALDQCHDAGECDPQSGCSNPVKEDGTSCGDGDACTVDDRCEDGVCIGDAKNCDDAGPCYQNSICNSSTGECELIPVADGTACEPDGTLTACETASCVAGSCEATARECVPLDDCHHGGVCDPQTGVCSNPEKANGSACEDGNVCTVAEACNAGVCQGGSPLVCTASDDCHQVVACDPDLGCVETFAPDGTTCEDGNPCTEDDMCVSGGCQGQADVVCVPSGPCKAAGTCDPLTGVCTSPNLADFVACEDSNPCTEGTVCMEGVCGDGDAVSCEASGNCYAAACDPDVGCIETPVGAGTYCNDDNLCTGTSSCDGMGNCSGVVDVVCAAVDATGCLENGVCQPSTGSCTYAWKADGALCDDGNACSLGDACFEGACLSAEEKLCEVTSCMVSNECDPETGNCDYTAKAEGAACDDDNYCTAEAECQGITCVRLAITDCSSENNCFEGGYCDEVAQSCVFDKFYDGDACDQGVCFVDKSVVSGIDWHVEDGSSVDDVGGALFDYNGDEYLDLLIASEQGGVKLLRNMHDFTFDDRTVEAGLATSLAGMTVTGVAVADFNNDTVSDLYIMALGANVLLQGNGDSTFSIVAGFGAEGSSDAWTTAAVVADYTNDGYSDLFMASYIDLGTSSAGVNLLFVNNADGSFSESSSLFDATVSDGWTMDARWSDYNGDGYPDLHICNDKTSDTANQPSMLWENKGGNTFVQASAASATTAGPVCTSLSIGDVDGDLLIDVYRGQVGNNLLLKGSSSSPFNYTDITTAADALVGGDSCTDKQLAARATVYADFNNDGAVDIYLVHGAMTGASGVDAASANALLLNDGDGTFTDVSLSAGVADTHDGRSALAGDLDNDGFMDLVVLNNEGDVKLYRNTTANSNNWIRVALEGTTSNADGYGAKVEVTYGNSVQVKEHMSASGPGAVSDARMLFGLGATVADTEVSPGIDTDVDTDTDTEMYVDIQVTWPSGNVQNVNGERVGTTVTIVEP